MKRPDANPIAAGSVRTQARAMFRTVLPRRPDPFAAIVPAGRKVEAPERRPAFERRTHRREVTPDRLRDTGRLADQARLELPGRVGGPRDLRPAGVRVEQVMGRDEADQDEHDQADPLLA